MSGLEVGTTTSAAEEVAKLAPGARVVESLFSFARQVQSGSLRFGSQQSTVYYCGDDPAAKAVVAGLIAELDAEPVDAGPLMSARYLEPASMLMVQLGYKQGLGDKIAIKLLRRQ